MKQSRPLLLELAAVILFFSLSACACLRIFAAASLTAGQSARLTEAVLLCQRAAEAYKAAGNLAAFEEFWGVYGGESSGLDLAATETAAGAALFSVIGPEGEALITLPVRTAEILP